MNLVDCELIVSFFFFCQKRQMDKLHPISPEDSTVKLLFIMDPNDMPGMNKDRPLGSFGPLPMRTGYDKLMYGTGAAYFTGM
jgi:hypothetical protein